MLEINCGVYMVTCIANNRRYIGSSRDIAIRWRDHRYELNHNEHHNPHWQHAWNKYGYQAFEWTVLEGTEATDEALRRREKHWIDTLHPEFNISQEAFPTRLGAKSTEEHKRRMSEGMKRMYANLSEDEWLAWNQKRKDVWAKLTTEEKAEWVKKTRYKFTPEDRAKMRVSRLKYVAEHPKEKKPKKKRDYVYRYRPVVHTPEWEAGRQQREMERREKLRIANQGKVISEEQKAKIRATVNELWEDPEYRAKQQEGTLKAMQDPNVLERLSESHKGYVMPEEQKQKIREANTGRKRSEATRKRLSEARRKMWAEKKAKGEDKAIREKISATRRKRKSVIDSQQ